MQNILLTRSINQSQELHAILENAGFNVISESLFTVKKHEIETLDCRNASAAIITSANACELLINSKLPQDAKIFAVGKKTAHDLIAAGFSHIKLAPEMSAQSLKNLILDSDCDKNGKIFYFHGSHITLDFKKELKEFNISNVLAYHTEEKVKLSDKLLEFRQNNQTFDYILLFSRNSADIFNKLARKHNRKHNMLEYFRDARILCFSQKILDDVRDFGFTNSATFADLPILKKFYD